MIDKSSCGMVTRQRNGASGVDHVAESVFWCVKCVWTADLKYEYENL